MKPLFLTLQIGMVVGMAALVPAGSFAADLPTPAGATPIFVSSSWAGLYAGSTFGYGSGSFRSSQAASKTVSGWGSSSGALVGYNFEMGRFVFGPEADIALNSLRVHNPGVAGGLTPVVNESLYTARLRGRFGYDFGRFMPFIAGGVAFNKSHVASDPLEIFGATRNQAGLTIGAGLDWRVTLPFFGAMVVRGEYVYDAYPTRTFDFAGGPVRTRSAVSAVRLALISRPSDTWRPSEDEAVASNWSGGYAGALAGALWTTQRTSLGGTTTSYSANGGEFGLLGGHNFMFGPWMLGFEGATNLLDASGTGPQPGLAAVRVHEYFETELRGRAGYAFGRFLPYVTAGLAWGRGEQTDLATGSERPRVSSDNIAIGGGVEYMLSNRWSARLEYLTEVPYAHETTGLDGLALSQTRPSQALRVGLAYYFH